MTSLAQHLERLELAAKTVELFLQGPSNNRARDIRAAGDRLKQLEAALAAIKNRCFSAQGESNWSHDILSIVVPVLEGS